MFNSAVPSFFSLCAWRPSLCACSSSSQQHVPILQLRRVESPRTLTFHHRFFRPPTHFSHQWLQDEMTLIEKVFSLNVTKTEAGVCLTMPLARTEEKGTYCSYPGGCYWCAEHCKYYGYAFYCCDAGACCCYPSRGFCYRSPHCYNNACF